MIQSNRNQCANAQNRYQGRIKKVLTVCSAGLLRSPTIAKVLFEDYKYNTRCCGISDEYALIPISTALVYWADEIVFADKEHHSAIRHLLEEMHYQGRISILNLPDTFEYAAPELEAIIRERYKNE